MAPSVSEKGFETISASTPEHYAGFNHMLIGGNWRAGRGNKLVEDRHPYTGELIVGIPSADERDLDDAFRAAAEAQPLWAALVPAERARYTGGSLGHPRQQMWVRSRPRIRVEEISGIGDIGQSP